MKKLVVVESPSKVKTLSKYLGKDYQIVASKGHIVDLPKSEIGVDLEANFKPKYVVSKKKVLQQIKKAFEGKHTLILAVDPDREGEAIGWHVANKLGVITDSGKIKKGKNLQRIVFTEITKKALLQAIKNPREIDKNLFDAQQARRVLDRLVGYKLSPLLWKKIRYGLSAGRVQSAALRLIVEREKQREAFKPEEYWKIVSHVETEETKKQTEFKLEKESDKQSESPKQENDIVLFELKKVNNKVVKISNQKEAENLLKSLHDKAWIVSDIISKQTKKSPKPPFKTSTLQQAASYRFGFTSKKTMTLAQKLYEKGLITYMRTDSLSFSSEAVEKIRDLIKKQFGGDYLPSKVLFYKTNAKVAQEAHEAIRPTGFNLDVEKSDLENDEKKLYSLIWQRSVASQMSDALIQDQVIQIGIDDKLFEANARQVDFEGYMKVYYDNVKQTELSNLKKDQRVFAKQVIAKQNFTNPPSRYNEASLIKALEHHGIGRPSTYVSIISTIQTRKYVEKEGKVFVPTDTGFVVTRFLDNHFPYIVNYDFTAEVESQLDDVANGKLAWTDLLSKFYKPFEKDLDNKHKDIQRQDYTVLGQADANVKCPECLAGMQIKLGRFGRFYSCQKWPECKGMLDIDGKSDDQIRAEATSEEFLKIYKPAPKTDSGSEFILKKGKYGKFWAHPDYPKVKDARPLSLNDEIFSKVYGEIPLSKDGLQMILKRSRFGEFWAHPDYPKVKEIQKIDQSKVQQNKKDLEIE